MLIVGLKTDSPVLCPSPSRPVPSYEDLRSCSSGLFNGGIDGFSGAGSCRAASDPSSSSGFHVSEVLSQEARTADDSGRGFQGGGVGSLCSIAWLCDDATESTSATSGEGI